MSDSILTPNEVGLCESAASGVNAAMKRLADSHEAMRIENARMQKERDDAIALLLRIATRAGWNPKLEAQEFLTNRGIAFAKTGAK